MQESRLFRIVYYLLDKGRATAPELADKFEVSVRTIYRDLDAISSAGIPIYATQGYGGGIAIAEEYVLNKSLLSADEKEQVLMAIQGIGAAGGSNPDTLLTKLGSVFQTKSRNWIEVDFSNWASGDIRQNTFALLKDAIFARNLVLLQYLGNNDACSDRRVAPLKLVFKSKDWYLFGYCFMRNDHRFFKLTRIRDLQILKEQYSKRITAPDYVCRPIASPEVEAVVIRFDKSLAYRVYDEFPQDCIHAEKDTLLVHALLPKQDVLYRYLLSFGAKAELLEPAAVRAEFADYLKDIQKNYRT